MDNESQTPGELLFNVIFNVGSPIIRLSKFRLLVNRVLLQQSKNSWFEIARYLVRTDTTVLPSLEFLFKYLFLNPQCCLFQIFLCTEQLLLPKAEDNSDCQSSILLPLLLTFTILCPGNLFALTSFIPSARHHPSFLLLLCWIWSALWHRPLLSLHWISWTQGGQPPTQESNPPSSLLPILLEGFSQDKIQQESNRMG